MERLNIEKAVKAITSVLPARRPIGHHEAYTNGGERKHVASFLEKGITDHDYLDWFRDRLCTVTGADQAIVTSSGSAALHLALLAGGISPGDEVLVPSLTYIATANAVVHAGGTPNFIDGRICLNPFKLNQYLEREFLPNEDGKGLINKTTFRAVTALIMVHLLGMSCAVREIRQIATKYNLTLIEDAAEALGSRGDNLSCGNMGDVSILSFNLNKIVTTGGGGALLSNDPYIIARAHHLAHQARLPHPWLVEHDELGWNYAMPPICAALGIAQLEQLPEVLAKKRELNHRYFDALFEVKGLSFLPGLEGQNCWLNTILTDYAEDRDPLLEALHDEAINARALFTPLHTIPFYKDNPRDANMGYSEHTAARAVCLPSGAGLI